MKRYPWPAFVVGILLLIAVVHGPSLSYTFVSDDYDWLTQAEQNIAAQNPFKPLWSPIGGNFYRPLPALSLTFDAWLAGRNATVFHADQVLQFTLLVLALAWFVNRLTGRPWIAMSAATLFAVYPAHHEVVSWLAGRPDMLATLWLVVSAGAVTEYLRTPRWGWLTVVAVASALAMVSKESGLIAPGIHALVAVVLFFQDRTLPKHRLLMAIVPSVLLVGVVLFIRSQVLTDAIGGYLSGGNQVGLHIQSRDLIAPITSAFAILNLDYLRAITGISAIGPSAVRLAAVAVSAALMIMVGIRWRRPGQRWVIGLIVVGLAWTYISFVPVLGLSSAIGSNLEGSRLFFGPSIGYCLMLVGTLAMLWPPTSRLWTVSLAGVIVLSAAGSIFNAQPWRLASATVLQVRQALAHNIATLIPPSATDVVVSGLPAKIYGAYAYWGPHIDRAVIQSVAGRNIPVVVAGVTPFPDSPYCSTGSERRVALIRWEQTTQTWVSQSERQARLTVAGQQGTSQVFQPSDSTWSTINLTATPLSNGTRYALTASTGRVILSLPPTTGTTYRTLRVTLAEPLQTTGYNAQRLTLGWKHAEDTEEQRTNVTLADDTTTFLVPLCQYPNWALTEGIDAVSLRIGEQGAFALKQVEFLTDTTTDVLE